MIHARPAGIWHRSPAATISHHSNPAALCTWTFSFSAWQVLGLCLGMLIGTAVHLILVVWLWLRTDWPVRTSHSYRAEDSMCLMAYTCILSAACLEQL